MKTKDMVAMTVRMDPEFADQITLRAKLTRRSRSAELIHLASQTLDRQASVLKAEQERVTERNRETLQDTGTTEPQLSPAEERLCPS